MDKTFIIIIIIIPLFNEYTVIEKSVDEVIAKGTSSLKCMFNRFSFGFVKCPVGCSGLVKRIGTPCVNLGRLSLRKTINKVTSRL